MGIERNTIGDIEIKSKQPTLVCLPEVRQYILDNLKKIRNTSVEVRLIPLEELENRIEELEMIQIITSSMRIDCIVAEIFNLSRNEVSSLIKQGKVSRNHKLMIKQDSNVEVEDIIALRGKSRVKVIAYGGKTKKERFKLIIGKYV